MDDLSFLEQDAVAVARQLLGWRFYRQDASGLVGGVIIETEAYTEDDAASHTFNGQTNRNKVMFGSAGHLYVYFTYGMHYCVNIVAGHEGRGEGVLLRALVPDQGIDIISQRRHSQPDNMLVNGPAKLCQALNIGRDDNGKAVNQGEFLLLPPDKPIFNVQATERIGIKKNTSYNWRFIAEVK